ncbi:MAG TPA: Crp/Fnr family transcriptional regulator [Roseiflexaceae bacterium]|nr:Crp/Fnr family transcriptional regulator [Roseiflexaceae bacterium]
MDPTQRRVTSLPVYTVADGDIFAMLPPDERELIEQKIRYAEYPAEYPFYSPEDAGDRIYILRRGRVRLYKLSPEGRTLTLLVLEPLAVFGEMALSEHWRHDSFAESMSPCLIGTVPRNLVRQVLDRHPAVAMRFMEVMSSRLHAMERKLADIAFKSVPQRLATVLLSLADTRAVDEAGDPPAVVRYTHLQLAEMIGSYRETVTKVIGEFRETGLIRIEEDTIYLMNISRLHDLAGR